MKDSQIMVLSERVSERDAEIEKMKADCPCGEYGKNGKTEQEVKVGGTAD